jgi:hypothetical protein
MVIVGPPNPEKDRPPQPRKSEVKLTFLELLPNWRIFSRFGEMAKGSLKTATTFYWLLVALVLGVEMLVIVTGGKAYPYDWLVSILIAGFFTVTLAYWGILRIVLWINDLTQKSSNRFTQINKGVWRLLLCLYLMLLTTILLFLLDDMSKEKATLWMVIPVSVVLLVVTAVYWSAIRVYLWIFDGFQEEKQKKSKDGNAK